MKCVSIIISGRVQGVFFRASTRKKAEMLGLVGWVRNNADGTVEAVFEGPSDSVGEIIDWCRTGSPDSEVTDVVVKEIAPEGFTSFEIRS